DISVERQDRFKKLTDNDDLEVTEDYRDLLKRDDIDAIAVLSPDYLHEEHVIAALQAGKHVYAEKPLAITTEGCDRIIEAWQKSGKHLRVGFNMRYMIMNRTMKKIIVEGVNGDINADWVRHLVGVGGYFYYYDWHDN